jgi:uncharacterized membrane protein
VASDDITAGDRPDPSRPDPSRPDPSRPVSSRPVPERPVPGRAGWAAWLAWPDSGGMIKAGNLEFERVLFFSDAVFAIAITLLVVDLRVPTSAAIRSAHVLRTAVPDMIGFGIGFGVIGIFWLGHHSLFRHIVAMNGSLIRLNLLFLGTIAFLPYPTALLSATSNQTAAIVFFAVCVAAAGLTEAAMWLYALRVSGLVSTDMPARQRRNVTLRMLAGPLVFVVSIPVAFVAPGQAEYVWIMVWVLNLVISRLTRREEVRNSRDEAPA